ncbi:TraB/GumN family protein [Pelagovum pacificum]|uniref:TraB/GumN family protein n=1 Tax=Pelagovum pacificum TaxID=2588711 RepID=A0A5C5G9K0_9RHOB|nr:TraB/GumN family protein [Pelagovum pacificum]QQA42344.1 TraB/GumN family protein [Pelagovum pacificum]TNY31428.1 TraB/GumN family protein [Pelagovum pacificum]
MRQTFAALALAGLTAGAADAQCGGTSLFDTLTAEEAAYLTDAAAKTPHANGLYWSAQDGDTTAIIVGTIHVADPRLDPMIAAIGPLVSEVDELYLEATPVEENEMEQALIADPGQLLITEGPTLPEMLDEETWQTLAAAASARQVPPFMASQMKPWYLSMALGTPSCMIELLASGERGLDHMLMAEAEAAGTPMRALEPWNTLIRLFDESPIDVQLDLLRFSTVPDDLAEQSMVAMMDGYFEGRTAEIWELSAIVSKRLNQGDDAEAKAIFDLYETELLETRNRNWVDVLEKAGPGNIMVAVGAGHLPGDTGLLRLLEQAGWTVEPYEG